MERDEIKRIFESIIMASNTPVKIDRLLSVFSERKRPDKKLAREILDELAESYADHSVELKEVSSGYRFQVRKDYAEWVSKLWEEKPARYSRALLETLALIAYKQPITRGEIEKVRGVSVSSQIIKTLQEREWVNVVGHRDVPGKPALYATTKEFLDYFNIKSLDELPSLAELRDIDQINGELELPEPGEQPAEAKDDEEQETIVQLEAEAADDSDTTVQGESETEESSDKNKSDDMTEALTAEH